MTGSRTQMVDREGLIELRVEDDVRASPRFNEDIAPTQAVNALGASGILQRCG